MMTMMMNDPCCFSSSSWDAVAEETVSTVALVVTPEHEPIDDHDEWIWTPKKKPSSSNTTHRSTTTRVAALITHRDDDDDRDDDHSSRSKSTDGKNVTANGGGQPQGTHNYYDRATAGHVESSNRSTAVAAPHGRDEYYHQLLLIRQSSAYYESIPFGEEAGEADFHQSLRTPFSTE